MSAIFDMERTAPPASAQMPKGWVVYQVTEVKPPATPTFEEAKAQVETQFKNERAGQLLPQKTQELADRAHAEHNLKKAAAELGATVKTSSLVSPSDQVPDVGSMGGQASVAFTMKPGDISGPINSGRNGVVLSLLEKQEPSLAEFDKAKDQLREQLLDRKRTEVMQIFAANLRARLEKEKKIRINQQEWDRITAPAGS
jgi:peptidyl-prolyl cis-trans isomerase D